MISVENSSRQKTEIHTQIELVSFLDIVSKISSPRETGLVFFWCSRRIHGIGEKKGVEMLNYFQNQKRKRNL